jgi:hypothetical protein
MNDDLMALGGAVGLSPEMLRTQRMQTVYAKSVADAIDVGALVRLGGGQ